MELSAHERLVLIARRRAIRAQEEAAARFKWAGNPSYYRSFKQEHICDQQYAEHGYMMARAAMAAYQQLN